MHGELSCGCVGGMRTVVPVGRESIEEKVLELFCDHGLISDEYGLKAVEVIELLDGIFDLMKETETE